jgi:hypothetical protein
MRLISCTLLVIMVLVSRGAEAALFSVFPDPVTAPWASFAFDEEGQNLACNYGGRLFLWSESGGFQALGEGHPRSGSIGISADGSTVCVTRVRRDDGYRNAALWSANRGWGDLGYNLDSCVHNDSWGSGFAVNRDGTEAVGLAWTCPSSQAFHWTADRGMELLPVSDRESNSRATDIAADGSLIVGYHEHETHGYRRPIWWKPGHGYSLYCGPDTRGEALAVSSSGDLVVGYHVEDQVEQAHVWSPGTDVESLGTLSGKPWDPSRATHVTTDGVIYGTSTNTAWNLTEAFVWNRLSGMGRLQDMLQAQGAIIPSDMWLDGILAVGGRGNRLVGSWQDSQGGRGHWLAEIDPLLRGQIHECLASADGTRLELLFDVPLAVPAGNLVLTATKEGLQRTVPVHLEPGSCRAVDYQADLLGSAEVNYELTLMAGGRSQVLDGFSIRLGGRQDGEPVQPGSQGTPLDYQRDLYLRMGEPRHLTLSVVGENGQVVIPLTDGDFPSGLHLITWPALTSPGSSESPKQLLHLQWR